MRTSVKREGDPRKMTKIMNGHTRLQNKSHGGGGGRREKKREGPRVIKKKKKGGGGGPRGNKSV